MACNILPVPPFPKCDQVPKKHPSLNWRVAVFSAMRAGFFEKYNRFIADDSEVEVSPLMKDSTIEFRCSLRTGGNLEQFATVTVSFYDDPKRVEVKLIQE